MYQYAHVFRQLFSLLCGFFPYRVKIFPCGRRNRLSHGEAVHTVRILVNYACGHNRLLALLGRIDLDSTGSLPNLLSPRQAP
jgi:hypothetical protein